MNEMDFQEEIVSSAEELAREVKASHIVALTETGRSYHLLREKLGGDDIGAIALTQNEETYNELSGDGEDANVIKLSIRDSTRMGQVRHAVWRGLNQGLLEPGEIIVCLTGDIGSPQGTDTISVYRISSTESTLAGIIESDKVMNSIVEIATELGWEGRKGKPIGTAFIVGDSENVMENSYQLGINPFKGYGHMKVTDEENWELIKRYSFLDGAFIIGSEGDFLAAGRYLDADGKVDIPSGLGTRHIATANITAATDAKGITVSGTDGIIRVFSDGKILGRIDPRSKMLKEATV
uniref:Protein containing DNA integrity scanning protein, DisA n=1 Tax=uncultured organism TaxID=155900 RepID=M1PVC3_9ZZZZ|nr:protein containing DNA integrity scanning protein, DisA [uncultured organism]